MGQDDHFDQIDREIAALLDRLETYRQAIILSRAAIWIGGGVLCLILTVAGTYRTPVIVFGAITALLAGTVWFGATTSSRADAEAALAEAEARKARLFEEVAARNGWVDMTPTVH